MRALNYHHLFYFWTVCQEGSFTKAAEKLRLSQSSISEQIRSLETVLGHRLMDRTTRRLSLTESGKVVLEYADTIFEAGQELLDFMLHRASKSHKLIRVGSLGSLSRNLQLKFLQPILDREEVRFQVTVGDLKRLLKLLKDHSLDVVLSTIPASEIDGTNLYTHILTESPLCIVGARKRTRKSLMPLERLLQESPLYLPSTTLESRSQFDQYIESKGLTIKVRGEVDDVALLRLLALSGQGYVVIPKMGVINDIESGALKVLHEFRNIQQRFYVITRQKKFPNPVIAELVLAMTKK